MLGLAVKLTFAQLSSACYVYFLYLLDKTTTSGVKEERNKTQRNYWKTQETEGKVFKFTFGTTEP